MENKYYLRIEEDSFGFVLEGIHDIKESDIAVTQEEYDSFFELQSQGKQFRLKEVPTGTSLFDYLEEYVAEIIVDNTPSMEERMSALESVMLEMVMGGVE